MQVNERGTLANLVGWGMGFGFLQQRFQGYKKTYILSSYEYNIQGVGWYIYCFILGRDRVILDLEDANKTNFLDAFREEKDLYSQMTNRLNSFLFLNIWTYQNSVILAKTHCFI